MSYKLKYLPSFDIDFIYAEEYLSEVSNSAARKLMLAIKNQMSRLVNYPFMCPVYEFDMRFRVISLPYQYLCFYSVDEDTKTLEIYRLVRGMRDVPNLL